MASIRIFTSPAEFREWLKRNHDKASELCVCLSNQHASKKSITYREALDEALCFGWIDGVRRSIDETSYSVRFTPRKPRSYWSAVNIRRFEELAKLGRVEPCGMEAFRARSQESSKYSFENRKGEFDAALEKQFKAKKKAWEFFSTQPPGYRKTATFWVMSAKKEETRQKRLEILIRDSAAGRRLGLLTKKVK